MTTPREGVLPGAFLIGAPKAGTTSVAHWLSGHPDVYWSVPKEPYFWASDYPGLRRHHGFDTMRSYEALFCSEAARSAAVRAEGSTVYLYSQRAISDIKDSIPNAKFIVCVRNPIDLVVSYHRTQLVALNEDEPDFELAWRRALAGGLPTSVKPLESALVDYPTVGCQAEALLRRIEEGGRNNFHIVLFDDIVRDPLKVYRDLVQFLALDAGPPPDFSAQNQSNKMHRYPRLHRLTHRPPDVLRPVMRKSAQWSRTTGLPGVQTVKSRMWRFEEKPTLSPSLRASLQDYFRPDVGHMEQLLGRDLGWRQEAD